MNPPNELKASQRLRQLRMQVGLTTDDWFNMVSWAADELDLKDDKIKRLQSRVEELEAFLRASAGH